MHECILIIVSSITYILGKNNSDNQQDALRLIVSWLKTILTCCEVDPNTNRMDVAPMAWYYIWTILKVSIRHMESWMVNKIKRCSDIWMLLSWKLEEEAG
mgnify:CR=1 FL=1